MREKECRGARDIGTRESKKGGVIVKVGEREGIMRERGWWLDRDWEREHRESRETRVERERVRGDREREGREKERGDRGREGR